MRPGHQDVYDSNSGINHFRHMHSFSPIAIKLLEVHKRMKANNLYISELLSPKVFFYSKNTIRYILALSSDQFENVIDHLLLSSDSFYTYHGSRDNEGYPVMFCLGEDSKI